jgi:Rieske Fe-S protein
MYSIKLFMRDMRTKYSKALIVFCVTVIPSCWELPTGFGFFGPYPIQTTIGLRDIQGLESLESGTITFYVDQNSPLLSIGGAGIVTTFHYKILVHRTSIDSIEAVSATCTYDGCTISSISVSSRSYICLCDSSQFSSNGAVNSGPATVPLEFKPTSFDGQTAIICICQVLD